MKQFIFLLVFIVLAMPDMHAQTFTLALPNDQQEFKTYSPVNFASYKEHSRMCTAARTGIIITGTGLITGIVGVAFILGNISGYSHGGNDANANFGLALFIIGGGCEIIGGGLAIGGAIHDKQKKHRLGIVAPKRNEIGFAYSF